MSALLLLGGVSLFLLLYAVWMMFAVAPAFPQRSTPWRVVLSRAAALTVLFLLVTIALARLTGRKLQWPETALSAISPAAFYVFFSRPHGRR